MMRFEPELSKDQFDCFVSHHPSGAHFMQSVAWGEFMEKERGMIPHYAGLLDSDGAIRAAALLLERKPPMCPPYFYCPRGFVIDFSDNKLLLDLVNAIRSFAKQRGVMFLKIDPPVILQQKSRDGTSLSDKSDAIRIIEHLNRIGFSHLGWNQGFENHLPRFTFRIDLLSDESTIRKRTSGNLLKNIRKGDLYPTVIREGTSADLASFLSVIHATGERDDFRAYADSYYRSFYEVLHRHGMATLYLGEAYPSKTVTFLEQSLAEHQRSMEKLKNPNKLAEGELTTRRLLREIEKFREYSVQYADGTVISAHLVVKYGGHAWAVHAGSLGVMNETFLNNRVYWHKVLEMKAAGCDWLDQFGTIGNPESNPLRTLHEFKQQFGGVWTEFIGEFDLAFRPFWYRIYRFVLPLWRKVLSRVRSIRETFAKR